MASDPEDAAQAELDRMVDELSSVDDPFDGVAALFAGHLGRHESGPGVAQRATAALDEGRAASYIRLGDGEGVVLSLALEGMPVVTRRSARFVARRHLGDPDALRQNRPAVAHLLEDYRQAILHAEVVGIPDRWAVPILLATPPTDGRRPLFGTAAVYRYLESLAPGALAGTTSAASFFHLEILEHLPALVAQRDLVLVTNHLALADPVTARLGARSVAIVPVPVQGSLRAGQQGSTGHFPDRYLAVCDELRAVPAGTLVLVAAGILAEPYCEAARQAGAVAIDIGSAMDLWAGQRTRMWGHTDELLEAHRLT